MRRLIIFCWILTLGLLGTGVAEATEGPPVKIRLLGEPRGVAEGEVFKGRLEILVGATAELTDFHFEGAGWRVEELNVSDQVSMEKDGRLEIPFQTRALAGAGLLEFKFRFAGHTVTKGLDLSREHLNRMTRGSATAEAPRGLDPVRNPLMQSVPVPLDEPAEKGAGQPDPEDQQLQENRTINVNGRFVYQRSDGVTIGADGVAVRIYDSDTFADDHLATVTTDAYGYWSVNINTDDAGENNPDLYIKYEAANSKCEVEDATWENNYTWQSGTYDNYSGSTLSVGWRQPADEDEHPALHILTDITRTWRWLLNHEGYDTPDTDVQWPDGASGAWYVRFWEEIHVGVDRQWNEATHSHEYMHHWVNNYADPVDPDYCNGVCDNDGCGHCIWCWETDHDAYNEGFPNWVADVLTRSYDGDYGIASQFFRDQENIRQCGDGTWDDPYTTEGFLGALLRDIEDSTNDDHAHYPDHQDVMSIGTNEIFDVADFDEPTTPAQFLLDFRDRYPHLKEELWETAKNCGYDFDSAAPGAVTNLTSSSHSTSGDSPDPTIRYTWTRASDDASGIQGYGIYITTTGPAMPGAALDIGDVTSYTTATLSPGTYYFNIRALDNDDRWSASYRSYGPVTIRAAEPSDLTSYQPTGWQYPLVLRNDATATGSAATVSATLPGNTSGGTYWNVRGINQGESSTSVGFQSRLYIDGSYLWWASWGSIGAGGSFYGTNLGPVTVDGGRHTAEVRYDAVDQVSEVDETNNTYGRQFIWTPYQLTSGTPVSRAAPPEGDAGWDALTGTKWYNCDGLRTGSPGWWNAVVVRANNNSDDYDVRMHAVSTGAEDGFAANLGYSGRPAGFLDAVIANRNVATEDEWDVGVLNNHDSGGSYTAVQEVSSLFSFGDSLTFTMGADDYLDLREFHVSTDNAGFVSVTVDVDPDAGSLQVGWLDENFETGSLTDYSAVSSTADLNGRARLDLEIPEDGYNCLVIFREPRDGNSALDYTLEIQTTPPDFLPLEAAGWHAPIVPRPLADGTGSLVALPDTLHGNQTSTYLNFAVRNESPSSSPEGLYVRAYIDGVYRAWISWGSFGANSNGLFNWDFAWNIPGGRHTLDMRCDPLEAIEERFEDNNTYGEQYCWSPMPVAQGTQVSRSSPPDPTGGWDHMASGEALWFNCDGLRIPERSGWWHAMAVMPGSGSNVDVRLHDRLEGVKDGFAANYVTSGWGLESSDFVLVNYNQAAHTGMDVGVLNWEGGAAYTAEHAVATFYEAYPTGPSPAFDLDAGRILELHEIYLDPAFLPGGGYFSVQLQELSGNVDWGISLHPLDREFMSKSTVVDGGAAWTQGPGGGEMLETTITQAGYYCLAVWKAKTDDLAKDGSYRLVFGNSLSPVEDEALPSVTGLSRVYPNPFNPQTTIAFDLAEPGHTEVAIYDLQGSLVRTLVSESRDGGRHEVVWNGNDNRGQRVASGVYMARLTAGNINQMRKLVLVK